MEVSYTASLDRRQLQSLGQNWSIEPGSKRWSFELGGPIWLLWSSRKKLENKLFASDRRIEKRRVEKGCKKTGEESQIKWLYSKIPWYRWWKRYHDVLLPHLVLPMAWSVKVCTRYADSRLGRWASLQFKPNPYQAPTASPWLPSPGITWSGPLSAEAVPPSLNITGKLHKIGKLHTTQLQEVDMLTQFIC